MMRHVVLATLIALGLTASARADFQFCNKTSYVLDLALALEEKDAAATRVREWHFVVLARDLQEIPGPRARCR